MSGAEVELSDGEIPPDSESNTNHETDQEARLQGDEPNAKKRKVAAEVPDDDDDGGGGEWQTPTKRQLKKMMKKKNREKRKHQAMEDKYAVAATTSLQTSVDTLNVRQCEILKSLVSMANGAQGNCLKVQKLKTSHFQNTVSHILIGSPPVHAPIEGVAELRKDYKVVVIWLSMVSADFFKRSPDHFPKLKKLLPSVTFDIEHPGSTRFVKLGLESFMMLATEDNPLPVSPSSNSGRKMPLRYSYFLSLNELSDNGFPNPSRGDVDELGRVITDYISITDWPSSEVSEAPQVVTALEGGEEMPMFAIDCEMVETKNGSDLARISIVDAELTCIYDTYVKPDCPILDYRTKYSGIDGSTLEDVTTDLKEVQEKLSLLLPSNSILVGHSLENDLHALKFRHPFVIDTSLIFTPFATPTAKPGLRKLCKELLSIDIQNLENGHNSIEDASSCMKLIHLKLEKGENCKILFNEISPSIFTELRTKGCVTGIVDKDSIIRLYGKGSTHSMEVKTDEEAVDQIVSVIPMSKFSFVQFHNVEYLLRSEGTDSSEKKSLLEEAATMDSNIIKIVESCPPKTIVFVACGSSDIKKVRSLQQQDFTDYVKLKKQVMLARTGFVVGIVID